MEDQAVERLLSADALLLYARGKAGQAAPGGIEALQADVREREGLLARCAASERTRAEQITVKGLVSLVVRLLSASRRFRAGHASFCEVLPRSERTAGEDALARDTLRVGFAAAMSLLSPIHSAPDPGVARAAAGERLHWLAAQVADIMSHLEFCRAPGDAAYARLAGALGPLLSDPSSGAASLAVGQMLDEWTVRPRAAIPAPLAASAPPDSHDLDWLQGPAHGPRIYFLLRLLPGLVPALAPPLLAADDLLDLVACCCALPGEVEGQVRALAHESAALILARTANGPWDAPAGPGGWFWRRYAARSLALFPLWTPFPAFAAAVVGAVRAWAEGPDLGPTPLLELAEALLGRSQAVLLESGEAASALRSLCFGLANVAPAAHLDALLGLHARAIASAAPAVRQEMRAEVRLAIGASSDYGRKPHVAQWYLRVASGLP